MTALQALLLGIVQGLGEFLPISSSGHLVLFQRLFGISEGAMSFDIFVHLGTLASLVVVMREKLLNYLREPLGHIPKMVVLGTIPTVIVALAFGSFFGELFDTGASLGIGFIFTALLLYFAESHKKNDGEIKHVIQTRDAYARDRQPRGGGGGVRYGLNEERRRLDVGGSITPAGALITGFAQGIAVTPAISRSGSTIAAGIICDFGRPAAVEFAFLLSIPVTLLAVAQDMLKIVLNRIGAGGAAGVASGAVAADAASTTGAVAAAANPGIVLAAGPLEMAIGFIAAAVTGYFAARYMLKAIQKLKLTWFSLYTGLLGVIILSDQLFFNIVFDKIF